MYLFQARKTVITYVGIVALSLTWGNAFVAIRIADQELTPVNLTLIRWFIASALFLALLPIIGRSKTRLERKDVPRLLLVSFANVAGTTFHSITRRLVSRQGSPVY